jgi:hypothetical protein
MMARFPRDRLAAVGFVFAAIASPQEEPHNVSSRPSGSFSRGASRPSGSFCAAATPPATSPQPARACAGFVLRRVPVGTRAVTVAAILPGQAVGFVFSRGDSGSGRVPIVATGGPARVRFRAGRSHSVAMECRPPSPDRSGSSEKGGKGPEQPSQIPPFSWGGVPARRHDSSFLRRPGAPSRSSAVRSGAARVRFRTGRPGPVGFVFSPARVGPRRRRARSVSR